MSLEQDIFQRTKIDFNKLIAYGFQKECHQYVYIQNILDRKLVQIQNALENELKKITLADVIKDTKYYISKDNK